MDRKHKINTEEFQKQEKRSPLARHDRTGPKIEKTGTLERRRGN